jgi:hypothetical protein
LNRSLESAQKALAELRSQAGSGAAKSTQALHKGLGKFLADARRDSGKFTTALKRDFEQARKAATAPRKRSTGASTRGTTRRTTAKRSTGASTPGTTRRTTAKRSTRKSS